MLGQANCKYFVTFNSFQLEEGSNRKAQRI